MARNYTSQELQGAIDKIVRTSIDRLYGSLGNRRTDIVFGQVQDAAAGVFISFSNAPYYVVELATEIVGEFVDSSLSTLLDLDDTVRATDRLVQPIKNLAPLANARSALTALSGASSARITSLTRIEDVPAYQRFNQSSAAFLKESGAAIRSGGNIVQTPEEARDRLAGLLTTLKDEYDEVLRRLQLLAVAIEDFDSLNLPATLSNFVISNSRDLLDQRYEELAGLDEKARLGVMRDVVLDVLAARSSVAGFGALNPTVTFKYFSGVGDPYADVQHPAVSAALSPEFYGPYVIFEDTQLNIRVDGTTSITLDVPLSYVAEVDSYLVEDYNIQAGVNENFVIRTTTESDVPISLLAGLTRSAQEIANYINADLGFAHPVECVPYAPQLYLRSEPSNIPSVPGSNQVVITRVAGDWGDLANQTVQIGDYVDIVDPAFPVNDGWYVVNDISGLPGEFEAAKEDGNPVVSTGNTALVSLNRGNRALRLTFKDAYKEASIVDGWSIALPAVDDEAEAALDTLGFIRNASVTSLRTPAKDIADFINDNPAIAPAGTAVLEASASFSPLYFTGTSRSEPTDNQKVVLYKLQATLDVTNTGGNTAVFTGASVVGAEVGDVLAMRVTALNDILNYGVITFVGFTTITATMDDPVVDELGLDIEVGPDMSAIAFPATVLLEEEGSQGLNDGEYEVVGIGGFDGTGPEFELTLARPLVVHTELGYQPKELGEAAVGAYGLVLSSLNTLTSTLVEVLDPSDAGYLFWAALPQLQEGSTEWFLVPEDPRGTEVGDFLEFRDTSEQVVSFSREVAGSQASPNLLQFTTPVSTTLQTYDLRQDAPAPSARLRKTRKDTYVTLKAQLDDWLELPLSNSARYFGELRKLINPLVVNDNPTAVAVSEASDKVVELYQHLVVVNGYLDDYFAPVVEPVDRLLDTYREQGAERAIDLLLEPSFSTFFNLSQEESSYSGELQRAIRDVNLNDLPINKNNRNPGGEIIESYEELDYEYDMSDTEGVEDVEPTGESYEFPGSAF